jgi:hypothetical protein
MHRHLARFFQRAPILEVGRDARAAEGVVADFGGDAGRLGATAHPPAGATQPALMTSSKSIAFAALHESPPGTDRRIAALHH